MKLEKRLAAWREAALISDGQAAAIREFEEKRRGSTSTFIVAGLGAVGGLAVVSGVISLIAANWDEIPPALKLAGAFALLIGSLLAAHRLSREGRTLASDLFLVAHAGLVLAMIGLVGQVYQLSGAPWRALALATALALPAAAVSDRSLLTDIAVAFGLATLWLFLGASLRARPYIAGFGWLLIGASVAGVLLLLAEGVQRLHRAAARSLRRWGAGLLGVAAVVAAAAWSVRRVDATRPAMLVLCAAVAVGWIARLVRSRQQALAAGTLALSALILGVAIDAGSSYSAGAAHHLSWESPGAGVRFLGFTLFCAAGASFAIGAAQAGSRRLTNLFTLAIAARVIALFLEVLSSLALTGFGLLLAGAVFCGVAWAWWKLHAALPVREVAREP